MANEISVQKLQEELRLSKGELLKIADQEKALIVRKRRVEKRVTELKSELEILNSSANSKGKFSSDDFPWSKELDRKLKVFNINSFRSHQKAAINATLSGVDLILVMPTGGGKSLCFQLPAIISTGVTLVVSPLISLMEDQLQSLNEIGIDTKIFNSQTDKEETRIIFDAMVDLKSKMKILYVTPEKLAKSKRLMAQVEKMYRVDRFSRLVIDEVHCCSQWGHDFRPDYKFLGIMKSQYPKTPIIGLTATATANVIVDIQKMLNIESCLVLRDSFYRPNLRYSVIDFAAKDKIDGIASLIQSYFKNQSGIIYCLTVKDCEEVSKILKSDFKIRAAPYHAQMEGENRSSVQKKWSLNEVQVIVATVAFGMGINKLDVRFVIHHSMSKSVENYYQETGRAGRDGKPAECILLFNIQDSFRASTLMMTEKNGLKNVYNMLSYSLDLKTCRKQFIANHFGDLCEEIENGCGGMCDNCEQEQSSLGKEEIRVEAGSVLGNVVKLLEHATRLDERMTAIKLLDALFSKGTPKLRLPEVVCPKYGRDICERILGHFLVDGYLLEDFHFTPYSTISYIVPGGYGEVGDFTYVMYPSSREFKARAKTTTVSNGGGATNKASSNGATATSGGGATNKKSKGKKPDEEEEDYYAAEAKKVERKRKSRKDGDVDDDKEKSSIKKSKVKTDGTDGDGSKESKSKGNGSAVTNKNNNKKNVKSRGKMMYEESEEDDSDFEFDGSDVDDDKEKFEKSATVTAKKSKVKTDGDVAKESKGKSGASGVATNKNNDKKIVKSRGKMLYEESDLDDSGDFLSAGKKKVKKLDSISDDDDDEDFNFQCGSSTGCGAPANISDMIIKSLKNKNKDKEQSDSDSESESDEDEDEDDSESGSDNFNTSGASTVVSNKPGKAGRRNAQCDSNNSRASRASTVECNIPEKCGKGGRRN